MDSILISTDGKNAIGGRLEQKDRPESFTVVTTLEVVLRFRDENYILVSYFRYSDGLGFAEKFREGPWAPPAIATPLKRRRREGDLVQSTQEVVKRFRKKRHNWEDDAEKLMSMLGVDDGEPEKVGELIEIKPSLRNRHNKCAYHVIRVRWKPEVINSDTLRNLADPLCVRGFAFIPTARRTLKTYTSSGRLVADKPLYFLGKPVVSSLKRLLCDEPFVGSFKTGTGVVEINPKHLVLEEKGFLIQVDMAGFGAACAFLDSQGTFTRPGEEHSEEFRRQLHGSFSTILAQAGISQNRLAGDGFLCGIPQRGDAECSGAERVARFLNAYRDHLRNVTEMNSRLPPDKQALYAIGSRLAIHYGSYNYGRISGPMSLVADFDGPQIIAVARSEAGLKQIGETIDANAQTNPINVAHRAIISADGVEQLGHQDALNEIMRANDFVTEGRHIAQLKEASIGGEVFRWMPPALA